LKGVRVPRDAETDSEIMQCFDVMSELRTHLKRDHFLETVRHMETEGFRLAYMERAGSVVAVAGYRIYTNLFLGKNLYVDDLVTSAGSRSKGYGQVLIGWLRDKAREAGCRALHLDSGTQRGQAHKFYFNHGFAITSYHFSEQLVDGG
jgi:GNAT superfamily N-acetyltransferase